MPNSDKWVDRIVTKMLNLSIEEAHDITRLVLDGRRGEQIKIRIYWNNLGAEEVFDLLPVAGGMYKLIEVDNA